MRFTVFLVAFLPWAIEAEEKDSQSVRDACSDRCMRIHERSLDRMGFSHERARSLIDKGRPAEKMRDVCWKMHDFFYCMKGCPKTVEHEKLMREVKTKCKPTIQDLEPGLSCLFKYRSFLEIRCSSFMNEAVRLRTQDDPELVPSKETCRYLHLNALCLENSVGSFCPMARPFFRRLNLRDFFLNFVLPSDDLLFDDEDLDECQMKDFVKEALEAVRIAPREPTEGESHTTPLQTTTVLIPLSSTSPPPSPRPPRPSSPSTPLIRAHTPSIGAETSTVNNFFYTSPPRKVPTSNLVGGWIEEILVTRDDLENAHRFTPRLPTSRRITITPNNKASTRGSTSFIALTPPPSTTTTTTTTTEEPRVEEYEEEDESVETSTHSGRRRVFESQEDLAQTPPNFYYSSFRGDAWKLIKNYSMSFPPHTQFVTPVDVESNTIFGFDTSSDEENVVGGRVTGPDRDLTPVTVRGEEIGDERHEYVIHHEETQAVTPETSKQEKEEEREDDEEEYDENSIEAHTVSIEKVSPTYEHAVDTQLVELKPADEIKLDSREEYPTTVSQEATTVSLEEATLSGEEITIPSGDGPDTNTESYEEPTVSSRESIVHRVDITARVLPTDSSYSEEKEEEEEERRKDKGGEVMGDEIELEGEDSGEEGRVEDEERKSKEEKFDDALVSEAVEETSSEIVLDDDLEKMEEEEEEDMIDDEDSAIVDEELSSTQPSSRSTPLINGGRVAVKPIKSFQQHAHEEAVEDTTQEWTDLEEVVDEEFEEDDRELYITTSVLAPSPSPSPLSPSDVLISILGLFLLSLLLVICCSLCLLMRSRTRRQSDSFVFKLDESV